MRLADQPDPELRRAVTSGRMVLVIPVGSTEQHGPHLPVSTDTVIATEVAKRLSDRGGFLQLPAVPYGVSYEHAPLFQISVRGRTLLATLSDMIESMAQNGAMTVFVVNGHHGNQKALSRLSDKVEKRLGGRAKAFVLHYWRFMDMPFDHAGLVETSLMLAISGKVDMAKAVKGLDAKNRSRSEIRRLSRLASTSFPSVTENGVWGDPTGATASLGHKILAQVIERLHENCQNCLTENL